MSVVAPSRPDRLVPVAGAVAWAAVFVDGLRAAVDDRLPHRSPARVAIARTWAVLDARGHVVPCPEWSPTPDPATVALEVEDQHPGALGVVAISSTGRLRVVDPDSPGGHAHALVLDVYPVVGASLMFGVAVEGPHAGRLAVDLNAAGRVDVGSLIVRALLDTRARRYNLN